MKNHWVTCEEYTAGPYDPEGAERKLTAIGLDAADDKPNACYLPHGIVVADVAPVPPWKQNLEGGY